ncbi:MAG: asparagine synthase [Chloroflexi bacterium]|nr:MAG: asparagine synthase [Chloroflexota bacterium]
MPQWSPPTVNWRTCTRSHARYFRSRNAAPCWPTAFPRCPRAGLLTAISYAEARTYMHDVLLRDTDQMSMAHSLEVRVPFLDHCLIEYLMRLPDEYKQPAGTPKRLLVESLDGLLPASIVRRPKQGFALPFDPWLRGPLREFCADRLGPDGLGGRGILRPDVVWGLWTGFRDRRPDVSWSRVWLLVVLESWLQRNGL